MTISLNERHAIEKKFHDKWAKGIKDKDVNYTEAFTAETALENRYSLEFFGKIGGKKLLDLGCGMGDASLYFASKRAMVNSVDISSGMIKVVRRLSKKHNLSRNLKAQIMQAEKLFFPDNYFDFVFGNGVLHHIDIPSGLSEVSRVLKKGGKAVFVEPLAHNPVINLYRIIAKDVRTPTEKPLKFSSIKYLKKYGFTSVRHHEFHFLTLLIFVWFFLVKRINPNKRRYWKMIIDESKTIAKPFSVLHNIDNYLIKKTPFFARYYWNTVIILRK